MALQGRQQLDEVRGVNPKIGKGQDAKSLKSFDGEGQHGDALRRCVKLTHNSRMTTE